MILANRRGCVVFFALCGCARICKSWFFKNLEQFRVSVKNSPEARVVYSLKQHLLTEGLRGGRVSEVIVDADGAYQSSPHAKALEPMATIWIDGFRPDLVCSVRQESCSMVAGFEVKADIADWPKGLTQARVYRNGVHHAFLAVPFSANGRRGNDRGSVAWRRFPAGEPAWEATAAGGRGSHSRGRRASGPAQSARREPGGRNAAAGY
jgi:hypothetical protein